MPAAILKFGPANTGLISTDIQIDWAYELEDGGTAPIAIDTLTELGNGDYLLVYTDTNLGYNAVAGKVSKISDSAVWSYLNGEYGSLANIGLRAVTKATDAETSATAVFDHMRWIQYALGTLVVRTDGWDASGPGIVMEYSELLVEGGTSICVQALRPNGTSGMLGYVMGGPTGNVWYPVNGFGAEGVCPYGSVLWICHDGGGPEAIPAGTLTITLTGQKFGPSTLTLHCPELVSESGVPEDGGLSSAGAVMFRTFDHRGVFLAPGISGGGGGVALPDGDFYAEAG